MRGWTRPRPGLPSNVEFLDQRYAAAYPRVDRQAQGLANSIRNIGVILATASFIAKPTARYSGRYADGQKAYRTNVPRNEKTNIPEPVETASGPHSRLQYDARDPNRIYSATEFDAAGNPVRRIDFAGRRGEALPHHHVYDPGTKGFGPKQP